MQTIKSLYRNCTLVSLHCIALLAGGWQK